MGKFKQGGPPLDRAGSPEDTNWLDGAWAAETARRAEAKKPENTAARELIENIEAAMLRRDPHRYYAMPLEVHNIEDHTIYGTEYTVEFGRANISSYPAPTSDWGLYYTKKVRLLDNKPAIGRLRQAPLPVQLAFLRVSDAFLDGWLNEADVHTPRALEVGRATLTHIRRLLKARAK